MKFTDNDTNDTVIASGINILNSTLVGIQQGTTDTTRIGRKITVKKIKWRFRIDLPATATAGNTSDQVRLVVLLDKQANGAAPAVTDVYADNNVLSFRNLDNTGRFVVLMDRQYGINTESGISTSFGEKIIVDTFFKGCNIPVDYTANVGDVTDIASNNLVTLAMSRNGFAGVTGKLRISYTDI